MRGAETRSGRGERERGRGNRNRIALRRMRNIWDISRPLTKNLAPWPGDTPFRYELTWRLSQTCSVNVGALNTSTHNGTHADAPFHFQGEGAAIDSVPLENYIGPAVVIDLVGKIAIIESLDLSGIEAGVYQFAALPLKIVGGDAAPVRALLWRD